MKLLLCGLGLLCLGLTATPAQAQSSSTAFQLQQFRPWGDAEGMFQTQSGKSLGQWGYFVGGFVNYGYNPLVARPAGSTSATSIVEHQLGLDIVGGVGLLSWLDVAVQLPLTLFQVGKIPDSSLFDPDDRNKDLGGFALSDPKIHVKIQALQEKKHWLNLAFQAYIAIPVGNKEKMNGEEPVSFGAALFMNKRFSAVNLAINFGYRYLPETKLANLILNHELFYSVGLGIDIGSKFTLIGELAGATVVNDNTSINLSPLELYVGGRILPFGNTDLGINIGVAVGLTSGYGAPLFRGVIGVIWSPKNRDGDGDGVLDDLDRCPKTKGPSENNGCPWGDKDGDGLTDNVDRCPKIRGPKENQGCPWPDTDGDGLTDNVDNCPKVKGPKQNKGCPWGDTDGDGIKDDNDKCPKVRGPKANKGCPYGDSDGDGIKDNVDKCPKVKGPKENQGCPDTDRDKDGIVDRLDKCPYVAGLPNTKNPKKHGCPKRVLVQVTKTEIKILQKIQFRTGSARILRRSYPILNQVVAVMNSRPNIRVFIQGHTDNVGSKGSNQRLSQRRAVSVRKYLTRKKIEASRLDAKGFGMDKPIVENNSRANRAKNRRVEFKVLSPKK